MSLLHKSAPALFALGVAAVAFAAAAVIVDANTPAQAAKPKTSGTDCSKVLAPDSTATPAQYMECLFPYGYNPQIR